MIDMSEMKVTAMITLVQPVTIGGKPIDNDEHVIYNGKVFAPSKTHVWNLPPVENMEGAPDVDMTYGFSFGGITVAEIKDWGWTINGEPYEPRIEYCKHLENGGCHNIVITVTLKDTVPYGRSFSLTATLKVKE